MSATPVGFSHAQLNDAARLGQSMRDAMLISSSSPVAVDLILGLLLQIDQNLKVLAQSHSSDLNIDPATRVWHKDES